MRIYDLKNWTTAPNGVAISFSSRGHGISEFYLRRVGTPMNLYSVISVPREREIVKMVSNDGCNVTLDEAQEALDYLNKVEAELTERILARINGIVQEGAVAP